MKTHTGNTKPMLTIVKVNVGELPEVVKIENELEPMKEIAGYWLQTTKITEDITLVSDEEGLMNGSPLNFTCGTLTGDKVVKPAQKIHGNAFFVSSTGAGFQSLDKIQIQRIQMMFGLERGLCVTNIDEN